MVIPPSLTVLKGSVRAMYSGLNRSVATAAVGWSIATRGGRKAEHDWLQPLRSCPWQAHDSAKVVLGKGGMLLLGGLEAQELKSSARNEGRLPSRRGGGE